MAEKFSKAHFESGVAQGLNGEGMDILAEIKYCGKFFRKISEHFGYTWKPQCTVSI